MICKNCGAEYSDQMTVCPYCGTENIRAAIHEHKEELQAIHERTEDVKYLKERIAQRATRVTGYVVAGIVLFFTVLVLITLVYSRIHAATALSRQNRDLETLESLYEEGRYQEMGEYLDKVENGYAETFEKYYRVATATDYIDENIEYLEDVFANAENSDQGDTYVSYALYNTFWWVEKSQKCLDEGCPYGEEEGINYAINRYREALDQYQLTEEEYEAGIQLIRDGAEEKDFYPMARRILKRMGK